MIDVEPSLQILDLYVVASFNITILITSLLHKTRTNMAPVTSVRLIIATVIASVVCNFQLATAMSTGDPILIGKFNIEDNNNKLIACTIDIIHSRILLQ